MSEEQYGKVRRRIKIELEPFFDGVRTKEANYELFKRAFIDFQERLFSATDVVKLIIKGGQKVGESPRSLPATIYKLFAYMGIVESLGNAVVDMIVMLLVANGRDFHIECRHATPRIKHAVFINDLEDERVPLSAKLNFLKENGIEELTSNIDTELRNAIAHLKFQIKNDAIYFKGKQCEKSIWPALNCLTTSLAAVIDLLWELGKEKGLFSHKAGRDEK
jgi:hypothetical protein